MIRVRAAGRVLPLMAGLLGAVVVGACSAGLDSAPHAGMQCVDDSSHCIEQRRQALNAMMADKSRAWIREQPTPEAYASGVRLFAFKSRKAELTCDELALARREADNAPIVLRGPQAANLTPAQISRGVMLSAEVSRELAAEMRRRCRASA